MIESFSVPMNGRSRNPTPEEDAAWNPATGGPAVEASERRQRGEMPPAPPEPSAVEIFERYATDLLNRVRPSNVCHAAYGSRLKEFEIGRKRVVVIGAPPSKGKTAFCCQTVFDALMYSKQEELRALIANVEMSPESLFDRQIAHLSGIGHAYIKHRDYDESARRRLEASIDEMRAIMPRLEFMRPPYTTERLNGRAFEHRADIVLVDYAQRFDTTAGSGDQRTQTNRVMEACRQIAEQDRAVIVVSAVNRTGYSREGAGLGSFRESSELEYGADSAWLLIPDDRDASKVSLKCVKNRHGKLSEIPLRFDGSLQTFTDDKAAQEWEP